MGLGTNAWPVGWQEILSPQITRRELLSGISGAPLLLYAGTGHAQDEPWYDLKFTLAEDQKSLTVVEIRVTPGPKANADANAASPDTRVEACSWNIPALAFGPAAFFDMEEPTAVEIGKGTPAPDRTIYVRNVQYGLRFPKGDKPASEIKKRGYVAFRFRRPEMRWTIEYITDLWLLTNGNTGSVRASKPALFHVFLNPNPEAGARPRPFEDIAASRVGLTLDAMFAGQVGIRPGTTGAIRVTLDRNLVWTLKKAGDHAISALNGRLGMEEFNLAWRRMKAETSPQKEPGIADRETIYFSGQAGSNALKLASNAGLLEIGGPGGHQVRMLPDDLCEVSLDVIAGPAPMLPRQTQIVSVLSVGRGVLQVRDGMRTLVDGVAGQDLVFAQTDMPLTAVSRTRRTVLWGRAVGTGPSISKPGANRQSWHERGTIISPVGLLEISGSPAQMPPPIDEEKPNPGTEAPPTQSDAADGGFDGQGVEINISGPKACDPIPPDEATSDHLGRVFQSANGDRGGAPDATLYVLHDAVHGKAGVVSTLRRIHFDLLLRSTNAALPDTSFSRLTFKDSDLRLLYEDGLPITELKGGEHPRPIAGSFVWIGPRSPGERRASFDLSGATLTCARDYDLMKLRFRFRDLRLEYQPLPAIVPARDDARVHVGEDGSVHDTRPILVAEFDPQHVLEAAVFRPEPPPLPDIELNTPGKPGEEVWTRERILSALAKEPVQDKRENIRKDVQDQKIASEVLAKPANARPFAAMATAFSKAAKKLPPDQQVYIGPFALDADGMGIARTLMAQIGPGPVKEEIKALFGRVNDHAKPTSPLAKFQKLLPVRSDPSGSPATSAAAPDYRGNAIRNETMFEALEPLYGVFRSFWRDTIATYLALKQHNVANDEIARRVGFSMPAEADPATQPALGEYLIVSNRYQGYDDGNLATLVDLMIGRFVDFALGLEQIPDLVGARLSGRSRLAFRIDCDPPHAVDAYDAGTVSSSNDGPSHTGPGFSRFKAIPFTFEGLTDWSRFEPAVTKRSRKLFETLPSGLLPRQGSRSTNPSDHAMMRFQGFSEGAITGEVRMAQVRASLQSERTPDIAGNGATAFPGEPLDIETAIELPSRLILSTAQDAVWRTNRRMPLEISSATGDGPVQLKPGAVGLEEGGGLAGKESVSVQPRDLFSVRLEMGTLKPDLRAVSSPDLRPSALTGPREPGTVRLPGEGSPPRGPYAPWFIGPEQLESGTVAPHTIMGESEDGNLCLEPKAPSKYRLVRWLCERAGFRQSLPVEDYALFRTSLDAYDRHQLVLLTSTYGLPVIGKRNAAAGEGDVDQAGALISDSGQIEPGETFSLLDATDDQALHKPVSLQVKGLSLTALGGSFVHETAFKPSAGANDFRGRKIFEGFSIDTLQQDIVLGRDIRTEVVYKGYLLPLGHKASFVKLTERIFLRTPKSGIKAMLRQRMFLRMSEPEKLYGALGQPHAGRMWCAKKVRLLADKTPDILDPSIPLGKLDAANPESLSGRIFLGEGPGLAFWPRIDITDSGLHRFEVTFDGTPTSLPMLFVDNIAATTKESLKKAVDHYNGNLGAEVSAVLKDRLQKNRKLAFGGGKIDFAPNSKAGEAQFETEELVVRAHGRTVAPVSDTWTGDLESMDSFATTGVLEGAAQPPFYPAMQLARIRLGPVERLSGGNPTPVEVQYDGHYVLYGFPQDGAIRGLEPPKGKNANPKEVFLNLRTVLNLRMGGNGDRAGGIARPESNIVAISRSKGPLGGDETTWWSFGPKHRTPGGGPIKQVDGKPDAVKLEEAMKSPTLVSLAYYFNEQVSRPPLDVLTAAGGEPPAFSPTPPSADKLEVLNQVQSFFSLDAKLLGTVRLKDLMTLLDLNPDSIPILKEGLEYGTAALRGANDQLASLGNDVRDRVLSPLRDVVRQLQGEWEALDRSLKEKKVEMPASGGGSSPSVLSLADIYPEVDQGLFGVERALDEALGSEDATALVPKLAAVHSAARELIRGLAIIASNPVERLESAVIGNLQARILEVTDALGRLQPLVATLDKLATDLLDAAVDEVAENVTAWVFEKMAGSVAAAQVNFQASTKLLDLLPLGAMPLDLATILRTLVADVEKDAAELGKAIAGPDAPAVGPRLLEGLRSAAREAIRPALKAMFRSMLEGVAIHEALKAGVENYIPTAKAQIEGAIATAKTEVAKFKSSVGDAERRAAIGLEVALDHYMGQMLVESIDWAAERYPDEVEVLVASIEHASRTFESVKRVVDAVEATNLQEVLDAGGTMATQVFGVPSKDVATDFRQSVTMPLVAAVREARKTLLPDSIVSVNSSILLREIEACASLKEKPPEKTKLPLLDASQNVVASTSLLAGLGTALQAIEKVRGSLSEVRTAAGSSGFESVSPQILDFVERLEAFVGADDAQAGGISREIAALYSDIIDLSVAVAGFDIALSGDDIDLAKIERIGSLAKHARFLASAVIDRVAAIARSTAGFVEAPENRDFIAAGVVGGNLVLFARDKGVDLASVETTARAALENARNHADDLEKSLVAAIAPVIDLGLALLGTTTAGSADGIGAIETQLRRMATVASSVGLSIEKETSRLLSTLMRLKTQIANYGGLKLPTDPESRASLVALFKAPLRTAPVVSLRSLSKVTDGTTEFRKAADDIRDLEAALLREWRALQRRLEGVPAQITDAVEEAVATFGVFEKLAAGYDQIKGLRNQLLAQAGANTFFAPFARNALLVEALDALSPEGQPACDVHDIKQPSDVLAECDRLAQEAMSFADARKLADHKDEARAALRRRYVVALHGWTNGQASPLRIIEQARTMGRDLLRGNVLSGIDLGAFRDQLEDAIAALIPTKVKFSYDFGSTVAKSPGEKDIFQPKQGSTFGIAVRASYDLMTQKSDFSASANIGPFDIYLIGGVVDALRLSFGGAAFAIANGSSARFDVKYEDFTIGKDLEFAQQLQSYLTPKEGNGVFIQPMTRGAGIEVGYGINLGTIGVGVTSFFNVSLNVSAELPFGAEESLFKVSLGRRLSPFGMGVLPFVGSGYFSIYAAADGVRGFEASFEYGGGGAIGFGPLSGQCRISAGVFVRILKADNRKTTEIYGTFFAGGSASIWVFHFATSLYVRLGTADGGAMYGEAIYSFSFSLGIADYDYSITAFKKENALGSTRSGSLHDRQGPTRFASAVVPNGVDPITTGAIDDSGYISINAADQLTDWNAYAAYFDVDLLEGISP
ncbi:hypothetical protein [Sinorhizobium meliloti]|uniref:hypothetical protein n=2 Tax=Sinorhizobium TaxID=28105 RepID=UPI0011AD3A00|nr:hypothetical protein [Sinorhizobium meliloti]MDW9438571.1 hypothetical protein [Sinorhizobium meliloti]MQV63028.1 hypothetical protein [Sinorhizobium meliloti]TWA50558.1 hypothetical protein FB008_11269 [Sinorhizobium medicae]